MKNDVIKSIYKICIGHYFWIHTTFPRTSIFLALNKHYSKGVVLEHSLVLLFIAFVPFESISILIGYHFGKWKAAKLKQGEVFIVMTWGLGLHGLTQRTVPLSGVWREAKIT